MGCFSSNCPLIKQEEKYRLNEQIVYRTNEVENAIDYLEQSAKFFEDVENPHRFKWLMISLHGALYGFGICAIKGTRSYHNVIKEINMKSKKVKTKKAELESLFIFLK